MNSNTLLNDRQPSDSTIQNQHFHGTHSIDASDVILYLLAFFFPPLSVYIRTGLCTNDFLLNILLTAMFGVPGTIHSIYIVYITSPITGTSERRVSREQYVGDYERIIESNTQQRQLYPSEGRQTQVQGASRNNDYHSQPPPYEEATSNMLKNPTDNKIQRP